MKLFLNSKRGNHIALLFLSVTLLSCDTLEIVPRKQIRDLLPGYERYLSTKFTDVQIQRSKSCNFGLVGPTGMADMELTAFNDFNYISLKDAEAEQELFDQMDRFRPFASLYMSKWRDKIFLLDLSNGITDTEVSLQGSEETYALSDKDENPMRVLIIWDEDNEERAAQLREKLHALPEITFKEINNQINF